jgi:hypothetical protein
MTGRFKGLALPRFEPSVRLVDDVGAPATTDYAAVPVARLQRLQAIANLHGRAPASFGVDWLLERSENRRLT